MAKQQRAFILYMTTWSTEDDDVDRESNLDELNAILAKGWRVTQIAPMSGHGEPDDETRNLLILEQG